MESAGGHVASPQSPYRTNTRQTAVDWPVSAISAPVSMAHPVRGCIRYVDLAFVYKINRHTLCLSS